MKRSLSNANYVAGRKKYGWLYFGLCLRSFLVSRHLLNGSSILDIGAADGAMLTLLSQRFWFPLAVSLERDPQLASFIPSNGICGDGTALPFVDSIFDFVISIATRKHIRNSLALMNEIARVLKPEGHVIIIDPHPFLLRLGCWIGKFDRRYLFHLDLAKDIAQEMEAVGLYPIAYQSHVFVLCKGMKK